MLVTDTLGAMLERRRTYWTLAALALSTLPSCTPAFVLRSAEIAEKEEFAAQFMFVPIHLGWGDAIAAGGPKIQRPAREFTGGADLNPETEELAVLGGVLGLYEFDLRYGLSDRVEIGGFIGAERVGAEIRATPLSERVGHPFSIAMSYGLAYEALGDGPFVRSGIDISKRFGRFAPFVNAYVSRSFTSHGAHVGDTPCPPEGYPGTVCGVGVNELQDEVRFSFGLGGAVRVDKTQAVFGVEPYIPIAIAPLACPACGLVRPLWGMYVMGGVQFPGGDD